MKCDCIECNGKGYVPCDCCDGEGQRTHPLISMKVDGGTKNRDEVIELQDAAKNVSRQCDELSQIFPHNRGIYQKQAQEIIDDLENQAKKVMK